MRKNASTIPETCERCGARLVRDPRQPRLCGGCTPPTAAASAIYKALAALVAERGARIERPALHRGVAS